VNVVASHGTWTRPPPPSQDDLLIFAPEADAKQPLLGKPEAMRLFRDSVELAVEKQKTKVLLQFYQYFE